MFQFQSGAIQRDFSALTWDNVSKFQFQSGAIQSVRLHGNPRRYSSFNSKVVRFKGLPSMRANLSGFLVSIPKWCDSKQPIDCQKVHPIGVSIPKWCDSKVPLLVLNSRANVFQFQSGAIQRYYVSCFLQTIYTFQFQSGAIQSKVNIKIRISHN